MRELRYFVFKSIHDIDTYHLKKSYYEIMNAALCNKQMVKNQPEEPAAITTNPFNHSLFIT